MAELSAKLRRALESECAVDMCEVIEEKRKQDFEQLQKIVSAGPSVSPAERTKAIYALGRWGDPKAVASIERVLPELDKTGLVAAVDALGRLGTPAALKCVLRYTEHPSPEVRKFVIRALGRFTERAAQDRLKQIQKSDALPHLRNLALKYVERTGKSQ